MPSVKPSPVAPPAVDERRASFEREALIHLDALYRAALRLAGNASDADDLVQETMLKAYQAWHQYRRGTNAKGWLLTILRHAFINEYRRRTTRREVVDVDALEPFTVLDSVRQPDPQGAFFDSLVDDQVQRAISELPGAYREILALTAFEGLRYEESAEILGVPIGTVKSRLFRARKLLQARLHDYAVEHGWTAEPARPGSNHVEDASGLARSETEPELEESCC